MSDEASTSHSFKNVVILGGGILGTELAYSLNRRYVRGKQSKLRIFQLVNEQGIDIMVKKFLILGIVNFQVYLMIFYLVR